MAKVRLHQRGREALNCLARELVSCPVEQKVADAAYRVASDLVRKMLVAKYPPKDMLVLKKYDEARFVGNMRLNLVPGGFQVWSLRSDDERPLVPRNASETFAPDEKTSVAITKSVDAAQKLKAATLKKLNDYYALISAATTFEAVLEVWPEAEKVRGECGATQLAVAITPDIVKRIRADIAARAKAA